MMASLAAATAAGLSTTLAPASAAGRFRRGAIPDGHLVPDFHQAGRNGTAHGAETGDTDPHTLLS